MTDKFEGLTRRDMLGRVALGGAVSALGGLSSHGAFAQGLTPRDLVAAAQLGGGSVSYAVAD